MEYIEKNAHALRSCKKLHVKAFCLPPDETLQEPELQAKPKSFMQL